ncbi:MAG: hypothetical protein ABR524_08920 [Thermoanaerobaculia bacterium]
MKRTSGCDFERELLQSLRRGQIDRDLKEHAQSCPDCSEAARVNVWMNRLAAAAPRPDSLPDPRILRLKAELFGTTQAAQLVLQPIRFLQRVAFAGVALCWAALIAWKWDVLTNISLESAFAGILGGVSISPASFTVFLGLATATVLVTVHTALAGE